jgi:glycerophosphoryl diester phosphodiesterase
MMRQSESRPLVEAHRGDSAQAPPNTLAAFRGALALGVPWIELDIHPTRDGELVVIHDDTVDRTTDGQGAVAQMTLAELARLDAGRWFAPAFAGERIPRLAEVIALVRPTATRLNIEVKAFPPEAAVPEMLVRLLRETGVATRCVVSSFLLEALLQARALAPEITLALIGEGPTILDAARQHHIPWIHARYQTVDGALIARAHAAGLRVNVWTVDDPALARQRAHAGVDKICSNRPAEIRSALEAAV